MSIISTLNKSAKAATKKLLQLGPDFMHPVGDGIDEISETTEPGVGLENVDIDKLPYSYDWGDGFPTTTYIDPDTNLLTTHTEGLPPLDEGMSVYDLYAGRADRMGDEPLFTYQKNDEWVTKTANEFLAEVRALAKGLMHFGLHKGDAVAFMCHTSYEWNLTDAAVLACGGVLATVYETDSAEQMRNIVMNSDAQLLIVETQAMREKADDIADECENLKDILCIETGALDALKAYSPAVSDETLDERIDSVKKTDLCSIVYTSGSTAAPKGVEMTHEDYCATATNLPAYLPHELHDRDGSILLFLPQAHSFARAINYIVCWSDLHVYISSGMKTLLTDLQVAKPTLMIVVPRVLEKVYNAASQKAGEGLKGMMFASAVVTAQHYALRHGDDGEAGALTTVRHTFFDRFVYAPIRNVLGGRSQWIVAGGAPLDPDLLAFFRGAGVPACEGYGLTETTAPCAFNPPKIPFTEGSVGIAFPGFTLRIGEGGEIQVKGPAVFRRYHKNDEETEKSFTPDGWYDTGDLGRLDEHGLLYITGRKKDLIITAGGKNVSPGPIEEIIQRCPLVSQALVLGDRRPFISALVTLDEESLRPWLHSQGLNEQMPTEEAASNAAVRAEVQRYVDQANEGVSRAESVRKFIILPEEFTQENGLLTPSMKVIRPKAMKRYANLLNTQMYTARK